MVKTLIVVTAAVAALASTAAAQHPAAPDAKYPAITVSNDSAGNRVPMEFWGEYDGHADCYARLGDTTWVFCADGYTTST